MIWRAEGAQGQDCGAQGARGDRMLPQGERRGRESPLRASPRPSAASRPGRGRAMRFVITNPRPCDHISGGQGRFPSASAQAAIQPGSSGAQSERPMAAAIRSVSTIPSASTTTAR